MKKLLFACLPLIVALLGCGSGVVGNYEGIATIPGFDGRVTESGAQLDLKGDQTYTLSTGLLNINGKYDVEGDTLTLQAPDGSAPSKFRIVAAGSLESIQAKDGLLGPSTFVFRKKS